MRRNHAHGRKLLNRLFCLLLCISMMMPGLSVSEESLSEPEGDVWCEHEDHAASDDEPFVFAVAEESDMPVEPPVSEPQSADTFVCAHESTERIAGECGNETEWRYESESHHVRTYDRMYRTVCAACGELQAEETVCESERAEHRFGTDGACLDCKWRPAPLETPAAQAIEVAASAPEATDEPTAEPTSEAADPTAAPEMTDEPTAEPTAEAADPTAAPEATDEPTAEPTSEAADPTAAPEATDEPTAEPSAEAADPTAAPEATDELTAEPSAEPADSADPTAAPEATDEPTAEPTAAPADLTAAPEATEEPTAEPTAEAADPTAEPTTNMEEVPEANVMLLAISSDESDAEEVGNEACDNSEHLHSEFVTYEYSAWEEKNGYVHVRTFYEVHGYYCMECDKIYYTERYENEQRGEHCLNAEGVCTVCGWDETSCPHTNTRLSTQGGYHVYTQLDEYQHLDTYDSICYTWCSDCGAKLDEGVYVETKQIIRDHVPYSWSGTCQLCGYSPNCDHPDVVSYETIYHGDYEYINSTHHRVKGSLREFSYCRKCGAREWGDVIEENATKIETHNWSEGTCSGCDAVNECQHEDISTTENRGNGTYEYIDESQHRVTYVVMEWKECRDCGYVLSSSMPTGKNTVEERHYFTNDVCKCGYVNECKHETTTERMYGGVSGSYRYTILDEAQHELSYIPIIATVCRTCWSVLKKENGERRSFAQDHTFVGSYCSSCGYNNCQHENTKAETCTGQSQCVYENDDQHSVVYDTYEITTCADCGEELSRVSVEPIKETSRHTYSKTGICTGCGSSCSHEHTTQRTEFTGEKQCVIVDNERHQYIGEAVQTTYCLICKKVLGEETIAEYTSATVGHSFSKENICVVCGYEDETRCKHENQYSQVASQVLDRGVNGRFYTQVDQNQHKSTVYKQIRVFCLDCGDTLEIEKQDETVVYADHVFNNGVCQYCGYMCSDYQDENTKECQHENTKTEIWKSYQAMVYADENQHTNYYNLMERNCCTNCGMTFSTRVLQRSMEELETHYYQDTDYCDCGFKNPCQHLNTRMLRGPRAYVDYVVLDDAKYHKTIYNLTKICADCRTWIMSEHSTEVAYEEHTFKNNVCTECGYEIECSHDETYMGTVKDVNLRDFTFADESTHAYICDRAQEILCANCGEYMGEEIIQTGVNRTEKHSFGSYPYLYTNCDKCGYQDECMHDHVILAAESVHNTRVIRRDEMQHTILHHSNATGMECADCGRFLLGDNMGDRQEVTSPHDFNEDGVCTVCAYRKGEAKPTESPAATAVPDSSAAPTLPPLPLPTQPPILQEAAESPYIFVGSTVSSLDDSVSDTTATLVILSLTQKAQTVEIDGTELIFDKEEHAALCVLPATEQVLVTLIAAGYSDVAQEMMRSAGITLSDDAFSLMQQILQRFAAMPADERAALQEIMDDLFLAEERTVNGAVCVSLTLTLRIQMGGVTATVSVDIEAVREGDAL